MHFKRLEMLGFKSFVDQTSLDFEAGVTAIVGPNGCGKSNVVDSLRWVMGEQSAKALRGARMEDVIFNGTDSRKALGMAEVSLTIDNHDHKLPTEHEEVTITRRTYRSGESEYLLNKVPCRLRDIHDLIMDTGLGTNAYSFLEQGKIDLIVSSRPADRRTVFEEAAGISKYKSRKEEALRKLEATEQNFLRINDIAVEVKRQINTLERQAQKAKRYQDLRQELTTLEVSRGRRELREKRQELRDLEQQWETVCAQVQELESQRQRAQNEDDAALQTQAALDVQVSAAQDRLRQITESLIKAEDFIAASALRVQDLELSLQRWDAEIAAASAKQEQGWKQLELAGSQEQAAQGELAKMQDDLRGEEVTLAGLEQDLAHRALSVQDHQNRLLQLVDQMSELRSHLKNLEQRRSEHTSRLQDVEGRLQELDRQRQEMRSEKSSHDAQFERTCNNLQAVEAAQAALHKEQETLQHTLLTLQSMIENFQKTQAQLETRLKWIEELKNGLEGYEQGAKTILLEHNANPDTVPGILGPVANFLRTEPSCELAFEAFLGHRLQYILADTMDQARTAIAYLAANNRGRATFIPWECFPEESSPEMQPQDAAWLTLPGTVGWALDLAKIDERFRSIFKLLLGNVALVRDDAAMQAARAAGATCTLVTLQGAVDSAERLLTGGNQELLERGLLGREREIEELQRELETLTVHLHTALQEAEGVRTRLGEIQAQAESLQLESREHHLQITSIEKNQERLSGQLGEIEKQIAVLEVEQSQARAALSHGQQDQEQTAQRLTAAETNERSTQEAIAQLRQELTARQQEYDTHQSRRSELKVAAASHSQRLQALAGELERLRGENLEWQGKIQEVQAAKADAEHRRLELQEQVADRQAQAQQWGQEKNGAQAALELVSEQREALQALREQHAKEARRLQQECDHKRQEQHRVELEKQQAEYRLKTLEDYLHTEYQLQIGQEDEFALAAAMPGDGSAPEDPEAVPLRISELKQKLAGLGSVNLVAMEEYQELQQRHGFLTQQLEDLKSARENLHRLITKINAESRQRFLGTFTQVKDQFKIVFRRLFNGGDADLVLLDENDLLESGIEIIARPPGKRLQNILLLSGGEKALTAIALLFAIFLIKPSPFCIFDEMDAPLDDNNTVRFGRILQEFAEKSQFIVITHNKITMEKADVLYGVTMQEPGISKLVSVKFKGEAKASPVSQAPADEAKLTAELVCN